MKEKIKHLFDWAVRNLLWIVLSLAALWGYGFLIQKGTGWIFPELRTLAFLLAVEMLAMGLSSLAVYVYTSVKFIRDEVTGRDGMSVTERAANTRVLGYIFLGVHILVGLSILAIYRSQFL